VLSDPRVVKLLEQLGGPDAPAIEPAFAPRRDSWVGYPMVEELLDLDPEDAARLLRDLERLGYLGREFSDKVQFCPTCNSRDLKSVMFCRKCGSANLIRKRMFEHVSCGFVGTAEDFGTADSPLCPKCRAELVLLGSDYISRGPRHACAECGHSDETPGERWQCRTCNCLFEKGDLRELVMYRYVLNKSQASSIQDERIPKARVRGFLEREGYDIREKVQAVGRSGAEHEIDLMATKRSGPLEHRIVVGFASAEKEVESEEVIKLYAKAYDVDAQNVVLVASPRLSEDAQHFARHYHMKVVDSDQLAGADVSLTI